jgi:hypothetical protein
VTWIALIVAAAALGWWWRVSARRACRVCGRRAALCAIPGLRSLRHRSIPSRRG